MARLHRWFVGLVVPLLLLGSVACAATPPTVTTRPWSGPFFFIVMADPQFGMHTKDQSFEKETELYSRAIAAANRLRPAFVAVVGDLVNKPADRAQIAEFQRLTATFDPAVPVVLLAGNHDVGNVPTTQSVTQYRRDFGPNWYSFDYGGCHFAVIDSTVFHRPENVPRMAREQMEWLTADLGNTARRAQPPRHTVLLTHHPLFIERPDEKDGYHAIPQAYRRPILDLLHRHGVRYAFGGHYHRRALARDGNLEMVTCGPVGKPLGKDPSGLCIVKVFEGHLEHEYVSLDAVPERVSLEPARPTGP